MLQPYQPCLLSLPRTNPWHHHDDHGPQIWGTPELFWGCSTFLHSLLPRRMWIGWNRTHQKDPPKKTLVQGWDLYPSAISCYYLAATASWRWDSGLFTFIRQQLTFHSQKSFNILSQERVFPASKLTFTAIHPKFLYGLLSGTSPEHPLPPESHDPGNGDYDSSDTEISIQSDKTERVTRKNTETLQ